MEIYRTVTNILPLFDEFHKPQAQEFYESFLKDIAKIGEQYMTDMLKRMENLKKELTQKDVENSDLFPNISNLKKFIPNQTYTPLHQKIQDIYQSLPR